MRQWESKPFSGIRPINGGRLEIVPRDTASHNLVGLKSSSARDQANADKSYYSSNSREPPKPERII
jgi:hypothetical protein